MSHWIQTDEYSLVYCVGVLYKELPDVRALVLVEQMYVSLRNDS